MSGSRHRPSGLYLESTPDEQYGVLPGEDRLVRDIMNRQIVTVSPAASVREAAGLMRDHDIDGLVVSDGARLAGMISAHDVVVRGTAAPLHPDSIPVHAIVPAGPPPACRDDAIVADAARMMAAHRLQYLPVVDREGLVVGVISLLDVAGAVMPNVAAAWLERIRKPAGAD